MLEETPATDRAVDDVVADLRHAVDVHGINGLSLLGGEPTSQATALAVVAAEAQWLGLDVMLYTGQLLPSLEERAETDPGLRALLDACDLIVDGPYVEARRSQRRRFIGSDNQGLHIRSVRGAAVVMAHPLGADDNTLELRLRLDADGAALYTINGWPSRGDQTR